MIEKATVLDEPELEFRYGQAQISPHDGLSLFGPYDADHSSHPDNISYGCIGSPSGIELMEHWSEQVMNRSIPSVEGKANLWPFFPGFDVAFASKWPVDPSGTVELDESELIHASQNKDKHARTSNIVSLYLDGIERLKKKERCHVMICVVPDEVWRACRIKSTIRFGWGFSPSRKMREQRAEGQTSLLGDWNPSDYAYSIDFRNQLKAKSMIYDIPIQIIRESTLALGDGDQKTGRVLTPISDRAWNLATGIYYKAGGKPWRLATAREGVCYIGISFRRTVEGERSRTACCAAQMFLDTGDGIVFLGDEGPWYSPESGQCHLNRDSASKLLEGVLKTYRDLGGKELKEIFLHSRSAISRDEFAGYKASCPSDVKLVGVTVRTDKGLRLYSANGYPVLRGTFWKWNDRLGYLWCHGFKWKLGTYDGVQVPLPLRIEVAHGDSPIEQVSRDIHSLTKLNYNACRLGSSKPVTIEFSDSVGEILVSNPKVKTRRPQFAFYI